MTGAGRRAAACARLASTARCDRHTARVAGGVEQQREVLPAADRGAAARRGRSRSGGPTTVDLRGRRPRRPPAPGGCSGRRPRPTSPGPTGTATAPARRAPSTATARAGPRAQRITTRSPATTPARREPARLGGHRGVELAPGERGVGRRVDQRRMVGMAGGGRLDQVGQVRRAVRAVHGGGLLTRVLRSTPLRGRGGDPQVSPASLARRARIPATAVRERTQSDRRIAHSVTLSAVRTCRRFVTERRTTLTDRHRPLGGCCGG